MPSIDFNSSVLDSRAYVVQDGTVTSDLTNFNSSVLDSEAIVDISTGVIVIQKLQFFRFRFRVMVLFTPF